MKVLLIAVTTLDGCITKHNSPGAAHWASAEDQVHFRALTGSCDVRVFGASTYRADQPMFQSLLSAEVRRIVLTRTPHLFAGDAKPGQLEFTDESVVSLIERLSAEGHQRVAVLGGGQIYSMFLAADLVDELHLTLEPVLFGEGVRLGGTEQIDTRFSLQSVTNLNPNSLLLVYRRDEATSSVERP